MQHLFITHPSLSHYLSPALSHSLFLGLWPAWKSVHDNLLQSGPTIKRRSFEHRYKTSTQHWNSQEGKKHVTSLMNLVAGCCDSNINSNPLSLNPQDSSSVIQFVTRGSVQVNDRAVEVPKGLPEDISVSTLWTVNSPSCIHWFQCKKYIEHHNQGMSSSHQRLGFIQGSHWS